MKNLCLSLDENIKSRYLAIASAIIDAIALGKIKSGEAMPSARELARQNNVNRHTIMAAYQELIAQGWIVSKERKGYWVCSQLPVVTSNLANRKSEKPSPFDWQFRTKLSDDEAKPAAQYRFNFSGGCPDIALFPFNEFKSCISNSLNYPDLAGLNYGNNEGDALFLAQIQHYLRRARSLTDKSLMVVNGSQEALFLIAQLLLSQGEKVAVESLGYRPAWQAFTTAGADLVPIRQTPDFHLDLDHLETVFKTQKIKLLYLTPLHQYPATTTISLADRARIYNLAARYQVGIIEDDYDHEFHYASQPLAPMAAMDPAGLVIYLSTFSKVLFPGCRLGFIAANQPLIKQLVQLRSIINHKSNVLIQSAVARWMATGGFERHLRKVTKIYHQRQSSMVALLNHYRDLDIELDFVVPNGGMALWVKTDVDAGKLAGLAKENDLFVQHENQFHLQPAQSQNRYIRLGYAGQNEQQIAAGLAILMRLLRQL